jgi:ketosteroid isomerase-like protein
MMTRFLLPALVLSLVLSCSPRAVAQVRDSAATRDILSVLDGQVDAWNRGDIEGYMQGYWKSDSLLFTSSGKIQRGWQATLEKYKGAYSSKAMMGKLRFSQLEVTHLSPASAWVLGHWELTREKDHPGGVFTLILRKFSDGWKVIHDHTSAEPVKTPPVRKDTSKNPLEKKEE